MSEERTGSYSEPHVGRRWSLRHGRRRIWLVGGIGVVVVMMAALAFIIIGSKGDVGVPSQITSAKSQTSLTLYYPETLPAGFEYVQNTLSISTEAVSYAVENEESSAVTVNIQPKPQNVQFKDFYDRLLTNKADVASAYGKAVTGEAGGKRLGSLMDDKVWVLLNADQSFDAETMRQLVAGLKPVR